MNIHSKTISEIRSLLEDQETVPEQLLAAMNRDRRAGVKKLLTRYYRQQEFLRRKREKAEMMLIEEKNLWSQGYSFLGGIDEAGRGPLAGPVVSACVILPEGFCLDGVDDSKKLSSEKREILYDIICKKAVAVGIGIADPNQIDKVNIYNATVESMIQAVNACSRQPDYLLIDAMRLNKISLPQLSIIGGDAKSQSIAAASVVAKVTRDRIMDGFAKLYPEYGFDRHKGYGTKEHISAIRTYGLSPIHRQSFLTKIL